MHNAQLPAWRTTGLCIVHLALRAPKAEEPSGRRQVDQVVVAALVDPHPHVVVAFEHLHAGAAVRYTLAVGDLCDLVLGNDRDDLATFDLAALHELHPAFELRVLA